MLLMIDGSQTDRTVVTWVADKFSSEDRVIVSYGDAAGLRGAIESGSYPRHDTLPDGRIAIISLSPPKTDGAVNLVFVVVEPPHHVGVAEDAMSIV